MKPYPRYNQSSARWYSSFPETWSEVKAKRLFSNERERASSEDEQLAASQKYGVIPQALMMAQNNAKVMLALKGTDNFKQVKENDFVISLRSFEGGIEHSKYNGCISPAYTVLRLRHESSHPNYFRYALKCSPFIQALNSTSEGIRDGKTITYDEFCELLVALPSQAEQKAIATFLDRETQRIDSLIEEKQTFIKLLKEKSQALISHVVTKGLNPNVEMQDSGIEWIGQVPKHWEKCRVKQVSSFITSGPRGWSDFISDNGNAIFLQSGDLNNELGLNLAKAKKVSPPDGAEGQRTQLQLDDVVVCITGANTGRVAVVKELDSTVYINQHLSLIRPIGEKVRPKYLAYFLSSEAGSRYYALEQYGLKEGLSLKNVAETPLMLPPVSEQTSIEKYLDKALATLSSLVTSVEESINLLKEHRTSLISAAVTGKIDVREAV
ncbi:restriction endonuclease subunit S [Vibrio cholerae]|nr:restriction endonuclease subunit S [Vibrio cholerae]